MQNTFSCYGNYDMKNSQMQCDVLIIGSGAAGLGLALKLAESIRIILLSKDTLTEGATYYAQGGVSAVWDDDDSCDMHIRDTLMTGAGLCDQETVRYVVERGHKCINWLMGSGVHFTLDEQHGPGKLPHFHLHQEGGHSHRRILHAGDSTGQAITKALSAQVRKHTNITVLERHIAIDLINSHRYAGDQRRCLGAYVLNTQNTTVLSIASRVVVLASGGAGKVYLYTSNPDTCTGDGIAMAWRSGCRIANMEFIQFHPTCLYHPQARRFLISEALRGEGAKLRLPNGDCFMERFDPRAELAPRDIVARAIDHEMKRLGTPCVYLDISHREDNTIRKLFPGIHEHCLELGIDICKEPIPVVPAAHYTCGGIMTDRHGRTDLMGLYAIGEVSYTGLHGANRMASNSLLECMVYAHATFEDIRQNLHRLELSSTLRAWDSSWVSDSDEEVVVSHNWDEIRRFMWDYVGIVRSNKRLQRAWHRMQLLHNEITEYYGHFQLGQNLIELRNIALIAGMIIVSAMRRQESRGLHYLLDNPNCRTDHPTMNTVLKRHEGEALPHAESIPQTQTEKPGDWFQASE